MRFIDEVTIEIKAGHGGAGSRNFRREKYVPYGGPDGGDGGAGGSVIAIADHNTHTLLDFTFRPRWEAEDGMPGEGSRRGGKQGQDLVIRLPIGTTILKGADKEFVCDLTEDGQQFIVAKGGRGGKGNAFFKSPTNQTPEYAQPGEDGEEGSFTFSLKLVADVGIIGFPNAGKSTLISRISDARPKIADYPFTTLTPNLGVVRDRNNRTMVVADIPGLIPGASEGRGLGVQFLKHVERTRVLLHLVDPNQLTEDGEPLSILDSFETINAELRAFSPELADKKQIVAISKLDTVSEREAIDEAIATLKAQGHQVLEISSVAGTGIQQLIDLLGTTVFEAKRSAA